jgi:hypothetical protein
MVLSRVRVIFLNLTPPQPYHPEPASEHRIPNGKNKKREKDQSGINPTTFQVALTELKQIYHVQWFKESSSQSRKMNEFICCN